jgi:hypothetical protein
MLVDTQQHLCSCCSQEHQGFCEVYGKAAGPKTLCECENPLEYHLVQLVNYLVMRSGCQMSGVPDREGQLPMQADLNGP